MPEKIKVLWLSDFACATGFAQVAHNLVENLLKTDKYELTVVGINHFGEPYNFQKWPFPIYPARDLTKAQDPRYMDVYGRQRLLDLLGTGQFDVLFTLQDTFILETIGDAIVNTRVALEKNNMKTFQWIYYFPVDGKLKENWVKLSVDKADFPVAYTEFGKKEAQRFTAKDIDVIYHGVNTEIFKPLSKEDRAEFRKRYFAGAAENKFVVTNINRNQRRKDIPRTIAAFAEFHKKRPNSILYLHMNPNDVGGNVFEMARHYDLGIGVDLFVPTSFSEQTGYPVEVVANIIASSDVVMSTTLGEGWGLSSIEAMACKVPIAFPGNTSLNEICANGRCELAKSGETENDWTCLGPEDMNQFRPLTNIKDMARLLTAMYDEPEKYQAMAEKAYEWVHKELKWEHLAKKWEVIFDKAAQTNKKVIEAQGQDIGRNELCPVCKDIGIERKWKKCREHNLNA